jgi:hypothetical protein
MLQSVSGGVCGCEHFDVESFEQSSRAKFGRRKLRSDLIVDLLSGIAIQLQLDIEYLLKLVSQPGAGWCGAKQVEVLAEYLPNSAMIRFNDCSVLGNDPESFQGYALRVQHSENVVIWNQEQVSGSSKVVIGIREHSGVYVAMRTDERQSCNPVIEIAGNRFLFRIRIEIPVGD